MGQTLCLHPFPCHVALLVRSSCFQAESLLSKSMWARAEKHSATASPPACAASLVRSSCFLERRPSKWSHADRWRDGVRVFFCLCSFTSPTSWSTGEVNGPLNLRQVGPGWALMSPPSLQLIGRVWTIWWGHRTICPLTTGLPPLFPPSFLQKPLQHLLFSCFFSPLPTYLYMFLCLLFLSFFWKSVLGKNCLWCLGFPVFRWDWESLEFTGSCPQLAVGCQGSPVPNSNMVQSPWHDDGRQKWHWGHCVWWCHTPLISRELPATPHWHD